MEIGNIIPHIEALIFASDKPLTAMELTELANNAFGFMDEKLTLEQIQTAIDGIVEKYRSEFYPFEVRESGGGLQFLTKKDYHKTVAQLNGEKFLKRLSTAALETLSIIAYKQPVTKGEIEAIRGVSSDYAIQRLLEKELVVITGRNEKLPGHPLVYATSRTFMDYFGINSPEDLPKLKEIFDETMVNPTTIETAEQAEGSGDDGDTASGDNNELLAVTQNGELTKARLRSDKNDDAQRGPRSAVENTSAQQPDQADAVYPEENTSATAAYAAGDEEPVAEEAIDAATESDTLSEPDQTFEEESGDKADETSEEDADDAEDADEEDAEGVEASHDEEAEDSEDSLESAEAEEFDEEDAVDSDEEDTVVSEEEDSDEEDADDSKDSDQQDDSDEDNDEDSDANGDDDAEDSASDKDKPAGRS